MDVYGYIYMVRNKVNGKVYIGQTIKTVDVRWNEHKRRAGTNPRMSICKAIKKYGHESFDVVELHHAFSQEELDQMEINAIQAWDSTNKLYGYNVRSGGSRGPMAQESRDKLSASLKQHYSDPVNRQRASDKQTAIMTPEWGKHMRSFVKNHGPTEAGRLRMSLARKGVPKSKEAVDKVSAFWSGTIQTDERKEITRVAMSRPEVRAKMRESSRKRWDAHRLQKQQAEQSALAEKRAA